MAKTDPSLDFTVHIYCTSEMFKCGSFYRLECTLQTPDFSLWIDHSHNGVSTGASTMSANDSSLYGWMLIAVVSVQWINCFAFLQIVQAAPQPVSHSCRSMCSVCSCGPAHSSSWFWWEFTLPFWRAGQRVSNPRSTSLKHLPGLSPQDRVVWLHGITYK